MTGLIEEMQYNPGLEGWVGVGEKEVRWKNIPSKDRNGTCGNEKPVGCTRRRGHGGLSWVGPDVRWKKGCWWSRGPSCRLNAADVCTSGGSRVEVYEDETGDVVVGEWAPRPRKGTSGRDLLLPRDGETAYEKGSLPACICSSPVPNLSSRLCTTGIPTVHITPQSFSSTKEELRSDVGDCASTPCFPHFILVSLLFLSLDFTFLYLIFAL